MKAEAKQWKMLQDGLAGMQSADRLTHLLPLLVWSESRSVTTR